MTDFEYALRTVTLPSGQDFEIAHAVAAGTLIAVCGTVAVPQTGSRWADVDPATRCEACERSMPAVDEPALPIVPASVEIPPEPAEAVEPVVLPVVAPVADPVAESATEPLAEPVGGSVAASALFWRRWNLPVRIGIPLALLVAVIVVVLVVVLVSGGGFRADPTSSAYQNGYAYGHDLLGQSYDVAGACTRGTVDDPASTAGRNFIAGCEAGYAARTQ